MYLKTFLRILLKTFREWRNDKVPRLGAALAFYAMFSMAPLLVIAVAVAGLVYGEAAARGQVASQIREVIGQAGAEVIQDLIRHASRRDHGILASLAGLGTILFGATFGFWQLQDALNTVWKVAPRPGRRLWYTLRDRFFSFLLVLGVGLFLLLSLATTTFLVALGKWFSPGELPGHASWWHLADDVLSVVGVTLVFGTSYKILPDAKIPWSDVWIGSVFGALLFTLGKRLISLHLGHTSVTSWYGATGSLVLILFWIYYSAQIFLFGAEFTRVYGEFHGPRVQPRKNAVFLTAQERARQGIPRKEDVQAALQAPENEP
jgi:membrane protein